MEHLAALVKADVSGLVVQVFFTITIVLMIRDDQKPPVATGIMTGIAGIVFCVGGSIKETLPSIMAFINGLLWLYIAYQRWSQGRPPETNN